MFSAVVLAKPPSVSPTKSIQTTMMHRCCSGIEDYQWLLRMQSRFYSHLRIEG
jgi:hypothetical protein